MSLTANIIFILFLAIFYLINLTECQKETVEVVYQNSEKPIHFEVPSKNGDLMNEEVSKQDTSNPLGYVDFPRNITDTYKGTWQVHINHTLPNLKLMEFDKYSGHFIFQAINKRSVADGLDSVQGDLILRNGIYSTDSNVRFLLQGIYLWRVGLLFMVANPANEPNIEDFVIEFTHNTSIINALEKADSDAILKLLNNATETSHKSECFFSIILKFKPVASDFNDKYAYLYDKQAYTRPVEEEQRPQLEMRGIMKSPNCGLILKIEANSIEFKTYYSKAINYVVMVALASFAQIILTIRQMEYSNTQSAAARVSLLLIGQQAMMDSYLCLIH